MSKSISISTAIPESTLSKPRAKSTGRPQKGRKDQGRKRTKSIPRDARLAKFVRDLAPTVKQLVVAKRKLDLCKEGYVDAKDSKVDLKSSQSEVDALAREIALAKDTLRAGYVNKPFKVSLWGTYSRSSSASTALTAVETITISNFVEWSSFVALFDIARCVGMTIHTSAQAAHATAAPEMFWNCAYDPENSGAYASIENCLAGAIKTGLKRMSPNSVFVSYSPQPVDKTGLYTWHVPKLAPILPDQSSSITQYAGNWFDTGNSTIILGYLKPYIPASTGVTTAITHYIEAHMEFKLRS
jgi:hypothetical protein